MNFFFNFFTIVGGIGLAIWGVYASQHGVKSIVSWRWLIASVLCFSIALVILLFEEKPEKANITKLYFPPTSSTLMLDTVKKSLTKDSVKHLRGNKIANDRVDKFDELTRIKNRAYITIVHIDSPTFVVGQVLRFSIQLLNTGETPANHFTRVTRVKIGTGIYPHEIDSLTIATYPAECSIPAHQRMEIIAEFGKLTIDDSIAIFTPPFHLYVWGRIRYADTFGVHDSTDYCSYYQPEMKMFVYYDKQPCNQIK